MGRAANACVTVSPFLKLLGTVSAPLQSLRRVNVALLCHAPRIEWLNPPDVPRLRPRQLLSAASEEGRVPCQVCLCPCPSQTHKHAFHVTPTFPRGGRLSPEQHALSRLSMAKIPFLNREAGTVQ
ncbi:hypothetical protein AAFF_G00203790 [Aldrovandia affinis]|uniref:Uncharacterized protein n=1 Tax=Aldrovandia affinis TaxID=143900 RepID=A0AAD7WVD4_9TELE|nr:hypothetical protein AAFF_G00203790 [Aldrovandia affinis]